MELRPKLSHSNSLPCNEANYGIYFKNPLCLNNYGAGVKLKLWFYVELLLFERSCVLSHCYTSSVAIIL